MFEIRILFLFPNEHESKTQSVTNLHKDKIVV